MPPPLATEVQSESLSQFSHLPFWHATPPQSAAVEHCPPLPQVPLVVLHVWPLEHWLLFVQPVHFEETQTRLPQSALLVQVVVGFVQTLSRHTLADEARPERAQSLSSMHCTQIFGFAASLQRVPFAHWASLVQLVLVPLHV